VSAVVHRYVVANAGELEFERVVFFSDAVFAIAVTLLVINIRVPVPPGGAATLGQFGHGLSTQTGRILSWALSFYVVARYWVAHHTMFRFVTRFDRRLVTLNLLFLACVAFLPYGTAVLGAWGDTRPGAAFYALSMATAGLTQSAVWFHAIRGGLTVPRLDRGLGNAYLRTLLQPPAIFLLSIPVALLVRPAAAWGMWALIFLARRLFGHRVLAALDGTEAASA
jgi:uncharacterized membrane protein